jgi:two-component system sensor histidine kinase UhpB
MLTINLWLIRRALEPLSRLTDLMAGLDPLEPGRRLEVTGGRETQQLGVVFNAMLERIEVERRDSGRRLLAAQEQERRRVARELHDEIGQVATSLTLEIDHAARIAGPDVAGRLADAREAARSLSLELNEIVRRLRPETLEDLGLASALTVLGDRAAEQGGLRVSRRLHLPAGLPDDAELAIYRVAQEGLTNVVRHAHATRVELSLAETNGEIVLQIADDGRGLADATPGNGIRGMRERAMLVGGKLRIHSPARGGAEVTLRIPRRSSR